MAAPRRHDATTARGTRTRPPVRRGSIDQLGVLRATFAVGGLASGSCRRGLVSSMTGGEPAGGAALLNPEDSVGANASALLIPAMDTGPPRMNGPSAIASARTSG